jgi:hypothetical protein
MGLGTQKHGGREGGVWGSRSVGMREDEVDENQLQSGRMDGV